MQKNGNILFEALSNIKNHDVRYIYEITQKGELVNKTETDFPLQIQSSTQTYDLELQGNYYLAGGKNLDAYQLHYPNFQKNKTTAANAQPIDHSAWNNDQ